MDLKKMKKNELNGLRTAASTHSKPLEVLPESVVETFGGATFPFHGSQ